MPTRDRAACTPETGAEDLQLVRRAQAGDREAVEALASRMTCLARMLAELNRRRGGMLREQDLEDLAQDLVMLIWRKLQLFQGYGTLESWVYRFAQLEFLNRLRVEGRRRKRVRSTDVLPEPAEVPEGAPGIVRGQLAEWIADLPPDEREVVRLKHEEDMTFVQISARTDTSPNTLKARYYKALSRIRLRLSGRENES